MAVTFSVKVKGGEVRLTLAELGKNMPIAIMRALNATAANAKTQAVRAIAAGLGIAQKRVKDNIDMKKAYPGKLVASVFPLTGRFGVVEAASKSERRGRIPLFEFKPRNVSGKKGGGVRYTLPGGRGYDPNAFIATMESGHRGVFHRLPRTRGPRSHREKIVELYGPSVPRVFANAQIFNALRDQAKMNLEKNLQHEVEWLVRGKNG